LMNDVGYPVGVVLIADKVSQSRHAKQKTRRISFEAICSTSGLPGLPMDQTRVTGVNNLSHKQSP